ncbi:hypothetical protein ESY86_14410 [Subsaximicrobium wynnwilliamsii]|uniref:Thioredoxin domain-containing protein n=1 Tax=Subsaximicrobium wynnwilliamsii TaxID=291179 RepID=A0A5C6ZFW3_9FLAO|nr:thioredoxin domain-containing protein [Subsaximicrobium wynnwilliamsii]TXD82435.1 hypothetical protein ESY87_14000 [Subsaximicrobium wynnwilliamsii]TXD88077.1 hypothetical protein ESY86_14410 [Subsaximicrobium wynnwilliamsii]TXE02061.1 hypothetical protein ESY88_13530 [Subsaximicrobium wynnwilliamsii]
MELLRPLFQYLDAENIALDNDEFEFQFNSHPDYPSLLAISDTLKFFNVHNGAFNVDSAQIELLPNTFIARLKDDKTEFLSFVEKKENVIWYTNGTEKKHNIPKSDFINIWDDLVLLAESDKYNISKPKPKNNYLNILLGLSAILFLVISIEYLPMKWYGLFYVFPIIGLFLSVTALKDLFKTRSKLLDKFCQVSSANDCKTVVNSSKWKLLETVGFSDLSVVFFSVQIVSLFVMGISGLSMDYFSIQIVLLALSVPIISLSIYYQKYIEKKWCPICLSISGLVLAELAYVVFLKSFNYLDFEITTQGALQFLLVGSVSTVFWYTLKNLLSRLNHLKENELKANRFKRNYTIFKKMLTAPSRLKLPDNELILGNPNANISISIVTSPFCGHCKDPQYMLKTLLEKYDDAINVSVLYNVNPKNQRLLQFARIITQLKLDKGDNAFNEAMDYWYETKDDEKWLGKYQDEENSGFETLLAKNQVWLSEHDINFTPCMFINGYRYPNEYGIADLLFFMDELIEDKSILIKENKIAEAEKL